MALSLPQSVIVVADDPIEAGMLALDLVQSGLSAQAVRDTPSVLQQLQEHERKNGRAPIVLVGAFRDVHETEALYLSVLERAMRPGFVAVVLRSQREAAEQMAQSHGWAGVAVRPVNGAELTALVQAAHADPAIESPTTQQVGQLRDEHLLDLLGRLIERGHGLTGGRNVEIHLESLGRQAVVAIVDGELVHAECDGDTGRHVLERLACWRDGIWQVEPLAYSGPPTLSGASVGLLAVANEYTRRVQEARQNLPYADCVCTVRWERVRPLPVVAEAMFRRIATGAVLADAIDGDGDDELEAFAALETRIKRGAVIPQIETAPVGATVSATLEPDSAKPRREAARQTGQLSPAARSSQALSLPARGGSLLAAGAMPMVDSPQLPARDAHPTTHRYRVSADGKLIDSTAILLSAVADAAQDTDVPPALPSRRPASVGPDNAMASASMPRKGMVTGWFGVDIGPDPSVTKEVTATVAELTGRNLPPLSKRASTSRLGAVPGERLGRQPTPLRISQPPERAEEGQRLSARPYAWVPAAPKPPESLEDEEPPPQPPSARRRWLAWTVGGVALLALVLVIAWPSPPVAREHLDMTSYRAAVELIDRGHDAQAMALLQTLVQSSQAAPEALLHLSILEAEFGQRDAARAHLEAYLGNREARHAARARLLYKAVFAASNTGKAGGGT